LGKTTRLDVSLGASGARQTGGGLPVHSYTQPFAEVAFSGERGSRRNIDWNLHARLAPAIDPLDGHVYERAEILAGLNYFLGRKWTIESRAGAARALSGAFSQQTIWFGALAASYQPERHLTISAGTRALSQPPLRQPFFPAGADQPVVDLPSSRTVEWIGFVALALAYHQPF
jgi:hypothetical protein